MVCKNDNLELKMTPQTAGAAAGMPSDMLDSAAGDTSEYKKLLDKGFGEQLTVGELACSLYEGTPHLQNLAETLARQHGDAEALTFFALMGPEVQKFWKGIAQELIDHGKEWAANEGSGCVLSDRERNRLHAMIDPSVKVKAKEVKTITVTDPDTKLPVEVMIYKEEGGGMGGVDASYVEQEIGPVVSSHGNGDLDFGDEPTT